MVRAEIRFVIDGTETTDKLWGPSGQGLVTDFVEELQVKSSGYCAEYGGSTGGVLNAITKTGSNSWRGEALLYGSGDALDAGWRPTVVMRPQGWEGVLRMNLRAIDRASTGLGAARGGGFIPFEGLGKKERYAEVLAHELGHAVWILADPERPRLVLPLQSDIERLMRRVVTTTPDSGIGSELHESASAFEQLSRALEASAEAAETAVWGELRARQGHRLSPIGVTKQSSGGAASADGARRPLG
jgi:hypothetical protein